jgi:hypothetical protein
MPARYTSQQKTDTLDAVDAMIASGSSVNKALRAVAADTGIAMGTIRGWRSKLGRVEPAGGRNAAAALARESLMELVDRSLREHIEIALQVRGKGLHLALSAEPGERQDGAKLLSVSNAMWGTAFDKGAKRGTIESAADRVEVTTHEASPLDKLTDALDRIAPREDTDGDA